jgi:hypothetical protein
MDHTVEKGECINSIADLHGFFWEALWEHPNNQPLRELRDDPNVLMEGDTVFIPELTEKLVSAGTGQTHVYQRKGIPALCRIQLFDGEEPRARQEYEITVDGRKSTGVSDGQGVVHVKAPPAAKMATLVIGPDRFEVEVLLGDLDPVTETTGLKARLASLGYDPGEIDDNMNEQTKQALVEFQLANFLDPTGEPDEETLETIRTLFDTVTDSPEVEE